MKDGIWITTHILFIQWCPLEIRLQADTSLNKCIHFRFLNEHIRFKRKKERKKESVQVKIAMGMIFIFNFMRQREMVWQIKIIMYSVNCFRVTNSGFTKLILTVWGCHLAITKSQNSLESSLWMYPKREMHQDGHFQNCFLRMVNMLKGYQGYLKSSGIFTRYLYKKLFSLE